MPNVTEITTPQAGGTFLYTYTVANPAASTGGVSQFFVTVGPTANLTAITAPTGFDSFYSAGSTVAEFDSFSSATDIAPGSSGVFSFVSAMGPAALPVTARSIDDTSGTFTDVTSASVAPVPEPSSLVLCGLGAAGLALAARRRRRIA
jgi:hypothetical protein